MKTTIYFERDVLSKRPYLRHQLVDVAAVVARPIHEVEQPNGRFRRWGWVGGEIYRVVVVADGATVHNAFPDPRFEAY